MRYLLGIFILTMILTLVVACRDDVIVEPPPPLNGSYTGTYTYEFSDSAITQHILFKFTTDSFLMDLDKAFHPTEADRIFCDVEGIYAVSQGVELRATKSQDSNRTRQTCQADKGPFGAWNLDQSTDGVVSMKSISMKDTVEITRTLRLEIIE